MLHIPSYELGRLLARFDVAAGAVKSGAGIQEAIVAAIPESGFIPSLYEQDERHLPLFPFSMLKGYLAESRETRRQAEPQLIPAPTFGDDLPTVARTDADRHEAHLSAFREDRPYDKRIREEQ